MWFRLLVKRENEFFLVLVGPGARFHSRAPVQRGAEAGLCARRSKFRRVPCAFARSRRAPRETVRALAARHIPDLDFQIAVEHKPAAPQMTALLRQSATWKFVHHLCHVEVCGNLSESTWCQPNPALGEMTARDDFSQKTKRFVALRAGYMCSFAGCSQLTTGPSDESSWAVAGIGDAAHICAASQITPG